MRRRDGVGRTICREGRGRGGAACRQLQCRGGRGHLLSGGGGAAPGEGPGRGRGVAAEEAPRVRSPAAEPVSGEQVPALRARSGRGRREGAGREGGGCGARRGHGRRAGPGGGRRGAGPCAGCGPPRGSAARSRGAAPQRWAARAVPASRLAERCTASPAAPGFFVRESSHCVILGELFGARVGAERFSSQRGFSARVFCSLSARSLCALIACRSQVGAGACLRPFPIPCTLRAARPPGSDPLAAAWQHRDLEAHRAPSRAP